MKSDKSNKSINYIFVNANNVGSLESKVLLMFQNKTRPVCIHIFIFSCFFTTNNSFTDPPRLASHQRGHQRGVAVGQVPVRLRRPQAAASDLPHDEGPHRRAQALRLGGRRADRGQGSRFDSRR